MVSIDELSKKYEDLKNAYYATQHNLQMVTQERDQLQEERDSLYHLLIKLGKKVKE